MKLYQGVFSMNLHQPLEIIGEWEPNSESLQLALSQLLQDSPHEEVFANGGTGLFTSLRSDPTGAAASG